MPEDVVRSLYLPLGLGPSCEGLLVPLAVVAEIVAYVPPVPPGAAGDWVLGSVAWRGHALAVGSAERLLGRVAARPGTRTRIAVLHALGVGPALRYYGLVLRDLPNVIAVAEGAVRWIDAGRPRPGTMVGLVEAGARYAWIPDLGAIERDLAARRGA